MKVRFGLAYRLAGATALLIVALVLAVVWQWTTTERQVVFAQKEAEAKALVSAMADLLVNELEDDNWGQVRVSTELLMANNPDVVYVILHDHREDDQIVVATPLELSEQFIPDLVPLSVTKVAMATSAPLTQQTLLLREVRLNGQLRARRGERIVEVASAMHLPAGGDIGVLRVGVSLLAIDHAVAAAVRKALLIGGLALTFGLLGAVLVARRLSGPVKRLADDAAQIAAGDLAHRARLERADELGQLAEAFNDMTVALESSFGRLRKTLESFERFVPRKFLAVVAPEGIENIQVGTCADRRIAVLFTDLRGFTNLSEGMTPTEVYDMLNAYFGRMGEAIDRAGGFVDKYIGDAMMALFDDEHTDPMLEAVLGMRRALREFNAERVSRGQRPIEHGIGMHCGEVVMGTIGFASKIESTVIGDAVNVASRVEALTKDRNLPVLLTEAVVARLAHPERFSLRKIEDGVVLRGRVDPVVLFTLDEA
ncbi:MAG: adenylate/guanylate cyclase domain-containing protein [Kofleriaceae bacterium]